MLAHRIQSLLEYHRRTATDLAIHCGVTPQAAHGWLSGSEPRAERKELIASFFGITRQQLEFSAVLSLNHLALKTPANQVSPEVSEQAAQLMITKALSGSTPRSVEFRQGMQAEIVRVLSGIPVRCPFEFGTCWADAFMAGVAYAGVNFPELEFAGT
jgi:hypothetical protein